MLRKRPLYVIIMVTQEWTFNSDKSVLRLELSCLASGLKRKTHTLGLDTVNLLLCKGRSDPIRCIRAEISSIKASVDAEPASINFS